MISIDPREGTPIYRQVVDQVKLMIMSGHLQPGDQLESVNSLSSRSKVNPMTVSKAYGMLVNEGVVERRKGVGIFVASVTRKKAERDREQTLNAALKDVASLIVRLGVDPEKAMASLREHLARFARKQGK